MTIWKARLDLTGLLAQWYSHNRVEPYEVTAQLPLGARALSVIRDGVDLAVYAEVDPSLETVPQRFIVAGTGRGNVADFDQPFARFLGTVALLDGTLVLHVFAIERTA